MSSGSLARVSCRGLTFPVSNNSDISFFGIFLLQSSKGERAEKERRGECDMLSVHYANTRTHAPTHTYIHGNQNKHY